MDLGLSSICTTYEETIHGKVTCSWEKKKRNIKLSVVIPPNTTASLYLSSSGKIYEVGKLLSPDNEFISETINSAERIISLQSGIYNFEIKN